MSARHLQETLAPSPRRATRAVLAGLLMVGAVVGATTHADSSSAGFTDTAAVRADAAAYTVPAAVPGTVQVVQRVDDPAYFDSRVAVGACEAPAGIQWRFRDRMAADATWPAWRAWSTTTSEPGWTGWSPSWLRDAGFAGQIQWEVRCGASTWTGTSTLNTPTAIVRTA